MTDLIQMAVLSLVAISCGLLGPFLVLKRMTMFANALSHTILLGIAVSFIVVGGEIFDLSNLFLGALIAACITALFTEGLTRFFKLQEDASIGLVFNTFFALGIVVVTAFMKDVHLGLEAIMGNADVLNVSDLKSVGGLALLNCTFVVVFYRYLLITSFDRNFGSKFFHFLFLFLVSFTSVSAFRAVGVLLVLGFLVGPYLTARLICKRLPQILYVTILIGVLSSVLAVLISRAVLDFFGIGISTAGVVVCLIGLIYVFTKSVISFKLFACAKKSLS